MLKSDVSVSLEESGAEEAEDVLDERAEEAWEASFSSSEVMRDWILSSRFDSRVLSDCWVLVGVQMQLWGAYVIASV